MKSLRGPEDYLPGARGWLVDGAVYGTSINISESKNLRTPGPQNLRESENPKGSQYQYQYLRISESQDLRISESQNLRESENPKGSQYQYQYFRIQESQKDLQKGSKKDLQKGTKNT